MPAEGESLALRLREHASLVVAALLLENERRFAGLSAADMRRVELLAHEIAARLLGEAASRTERAPAAQARAIAELFALDQSPSERRRRRVSV